MLLRALVSQFVRSAAEQKLREVATEAMRRHASPDSKSENGGSEGGGAEHGDVEGSDVEHRDEKGGDVGAPRPCCKIVLLFGHSVEAGGMIDLLVGDIVTRFASMTEHIGEFQSASIAVVVTGEGSERAGQAAQDVIELHKPDWIISAGFSSALTNELGRGVVLMADQVESSDGERLEVGFQIAPEIVERTKGLAVGRLVTVDQAITTPEQRMSLFEKHAATACDMESSGIARVCKEKGVRFMAIRVITDLLDDRLPIEIEKLNEQTSLLGKAGVAAGAVFHRISSVKDMWRVKEEAVRASDRLARFLSGVLPQLKDS